jgi:hypothetical protein
MPTHRRCLNYTPFGAGMCTFGKMPVGPILQGPAVPCVFGLIVEESSNGSSAKSFDNPSKLVAKSASMTMRNVFGVLVGASGSGLVFMMLR